MTKTTDRELLILAAKAAGVEGEYESWTGQGFKEGIRQVLNGEKCLRPWNPLTDDGDAFRLAIVTMNMNLSDLVEFLTLSGQTNELIGAALVRRAIVWAVSQNQKGTP